MRSARLEWQLLSTAFRTSDVAPKIGMGQELRSQGDFQAWLAAQSVDQRGLHISSPECSQAISLACRLLLASRVQRTAEAGLIAARKLSVDFRFRPLITSHTGQARRNSGFIIRNNARCKISVTISGRDCRRSRSVRLALLRPRSRRLAVFATETDQYGECQQAPRRLDLRYSAGVFSGSDALRTASQFEFRLDTAFGTAAPHSRAEPCFAVYSSRGWQRDVHVHSVRTCGGARCGNREEDLGV